MSMATHTVTQSELEKIEELKEARHLASVHGDRANHLRDELLKVLEANDAEYALTASGAPAAHIETQHRRKVNAKKLEALYPDVYAAVVEESTVTILKTDIS